MDAGAKLMHQIEMIKGIPGRVLANWPAFLGFAAVNYVSNLALMLIPRVGGVAGTIETAALQGAVQVIDHVTWEAVHVQ
jgi:hypothetical protein